MKKTRKVGKNILLIIDKNLLDRKQEASTMEKIDKYFKLKVFALLMTLLGH